MQQNDNSPARIFNVVETGIIDVLKPGRILSENGVNQVGKLTSMEKGKTITVAYGMSAVGTYISLMFIFPGKRIVDALNGSPLGSIGTALLMDGLILLCLRGGYFTSKLK